MPMLYRGLSRWPGRLKWLSGSSPKMSAPAPARRRALKKPQGNPLSFVANAAIGALAYLAVSLLTIAVVRDAPPGFWLLGPAAFFVVSFARGSGDRILWARSVSLSLGAWCAMFYLLTGFERYPSLAEWRASLPWMSMAIISSVCGVVSRRLLARLFCAN